MTDKNLQEIFKNEFEIEEYDSIFSQIKIVENPQNSDVVSFIAPNVYIEKWIKTKYLQRLAEILEKHYNITPEIHVVTAVKKNHVKSLKQGAKKMEAALNASYTFETFIQGDSNKFAYEIAKKICEKQGKAYNPVLFYGGTGLGKTHLLNAIGNKVIEKNKSVIYITSEQFLNDYSERLKSNTMEKFREKYRNCDYLLIDDIQFFAGKIQIQEEFFHTFNELHLKNKQIVITADKSLKQILGLEERLKSRCEWGITADIQPPGIETKIEIIKQKCIIHHVEINQDIIECLAYNIGGNIRQIEGIILKLNALPLLIGQPITLSMAQNAIKDIRKEVSENIDINAIIKATAREFNIKPSEITSKSRATKIAQARRIVIYLSRELIPHSMAMIAQSLNMKDHSAVSKAGTKINKELKEDPALQLAINEIKSKL